jgi:hypothetical protein
MFNSLSVIWPTRRMQSTRSASALLLVMAVFSAASGNATASDAKATEAATLSAEVTFQFVNDTGRALNLKLFSRGESLTQWPAKTKAYSLRPADAVQQLKIKCIEGENICWGAWATVQSVSGEMMGTGGRSTFTATMNAGVGQKGILECTGCCHICTPGLVVPAKRLSVSSSVGPQVR